MEYEISKFTIEGIDGYGSIIIRLTASTEYGLCLSENAYKKEDTHKSTPINRYERSSIKSYEAAKRAYQKRVRPYWKQGIEQGLNAWTMTCAGSENKAKRDYPSGK